MNSFYHIPVILGATAVGKTRLAAHVAYYYGGEIISADSRQVYKQLNLGTGKDYEEYNVFKTAIPYHLLDLVETTDRYNVHRFKMDCNKAIQDILARNKLPIVCGGSGLYIDSLFKQLNYTAVPVNEVLRVELRDEPLNDLQNRFHKLQKTSYTPLADISTRNRCIRAIEICLWLRSNPEPTEDKNSLRPLFIGLKDNVEIRRENIAKRLQQRLQNGLIEEVETLIKKGVNPDQLIYFGLEYKFITLYVLGRLQKEEMIMQLQTGINQFAKRQMTYFRKMEREGCNIHWIDASLPLENKLAAFHGYFENSRNKN